MQAGAPLLTAEQMRAAELAARDAGTPLSELMERAGAALADLVWRVAAGRPVTVLCGPGNNGGDGYVAARMLRDRGADIRVLAFGQPSTDLVKDAESLWGGQVSSVDAGNAGIGSIMVDCLFGTGLSRALESRLAEQLAAIAARAHRTIAADLPSGLATDDGTLLGCPYHADLTLAFGAYKPAHTLFPAAGHCGEILLENIGLSPACTVTVAEMPSLTPPGPQDHKYIRGLVAVIAGSMAGAAELAARAALRGGAGYVRLLGSTLPPSAPHAIVRKSRLDETTLADDRIAALVVGCGLGLGEEAKRRYTLALDSKRPMVIDGDALSLVDGPLAVPAIMTPHAGEFARFGIADQGSKIDRTLAAARHFNAVVVHKGADTVIAAPDGRAAVHSPGNVWLSTAGTGDVLAGICGAMLARGMDPFDAAMAAVLMHNAAADVAGPGLCADDLVQQPLLSR